MSSPQSEVRVFPTLESRLIVHADDFGETSEITKGILECIEAGVVTSTSILANMPATDEAIELAKQYHSHKKASFGLHLNLCEGTPLTRPSSLTRQDGTFLPKRQLFLRALRGKLDLVEVANEIAAQLHRLTAAGVQVSHIDSHKHMHQLPGVNLVVAEVAKRYGIERVRCTLEHGFWPKGTSLVPGLQRLVRRSLARRLLTRLQERGLRNPARAFDVRELMKQEDDTAREHLLRRPNEVSEMFCHPGTPEADKEKPGSCARDEESRYLRSEAFKDLVRKADARLVTYWEV